ncbi:MAG: cytidylate kinase-like family protein [Blautia sp.]|nr:cytidylate kinase-like family protein [Blautia sp.]MDY4516201.1 cytidylate kinase-like family protein [Lachnospiraceae bacterium]
MEKVIITIARQYGSGGKTIGQMLAKDMGIPVYSREILRMASDDSGIREELFNQADERLRNNPLFGASKKIYKGGLIAPSSGDFVSDENLFNYQAKVIKDLAERGSCVLVGRCADFVLKDRDDVVSVFIHAPKDYCMARALERNDMSEKEMEKFIAKTDKYRGDFYHYYTGNIWSDARNYDLCLNSSKLGFEKCVEEIKSYIQVRFH